MGFDSPKPLGEGETGGHTALPMWMDFMRDALKDIPETDFNQPTGFADGRGPNGMVRDGSYDDYHTDQANKRSGKPAKKKPKKAVVRSTDSGRTPSHRDDDTDEGADFSAPSGGGGGKSVEPLF